MTRRHTEHGGQPVTAGAEDELRMCLRLAGHGPGEASLSLPQAGGA
ncbi:hypothetical protein ACFWIN_09105 [Streptomyces sp. NPDC127049]